jgi:hypothetical protein
MKSTNLIGIVLIVLGALALVYQGFTYTRQEKVLDVGRSTLPPRNMSTFQFRQYLAGWLWWAGSSYCLLAPGKLLSSKLNKVSRLRVGQRMTLSQTSL